jgi:hypothetical protein
MLVEPRRRPVWPTNPPVRSEALLALAVDCGRIMTSCLPKQVTRRSENQKANRLWKCLIFQAWPIGLLVFKIHVIICAVNGTRLRKIQICFPGNPLLRLVLATMQMLRRTEKMR